MSDFLIMNEQDSEQNHNNNKKKSKNRFLSSLNDFLLSFQKIKIKEKAIFFRLMSTMVDAGLGISKSVSVLESQEKSPILKQILQRFYQELQDGKNFSYCMELFPNHFNESEIGVIKSGEKTGKLKYALLNLAQQVEKIALISNKFKSALIYPFFIILIVLFVVVVLMVVVVPKLLEIFGSTQDLPSSTKILIFTSSIFVNYWMLILFVFLIFWVLFSMGIKTPQGKYKFESIVMHIPLFGQIFKKMILSKFSRIFSTLIRSGVSMVESLNISAISVGSEIYKQRILLLAEDVKSGIKIHTSLDDDTLFPNMMVQMIKVGEDTAELGNIIEKLANFYEEQVDEIIQNINKFFEPIIIIILAIIVGGIALGILEPIMRISETINR